MENSSTNSFLEVQKFDQKWLWILLIVVSIVILGVQFSIFFSSSVETSGFGFYSSLFNVFLVLILGGLFAVIRLKTNIDKEKISMKFFPFVKKEVAWRDIRKAEVLDYGFVGGWGIRLWTKYGTVYNTKGSKGLFIQLNDDKKFLIGTQRPDELANFIKRIEGDEQ
jgi:hypothetical protein